MPAGDRSSAGFTETLLDSAAHTTTGNSGVVSEGWDAVSTIRVQLEVTAASGTTPNLVVLLEDSLDGTNWNAVASFAAKTATGREVVNVTAPFAEQMRVSWTITGTTPSFTFSVVAYTE